MEKLSLFPNLEVLILDKNDIEVKHPYVVATFIKSNPNRILKLALD